MARNPSKTMPLMGHLHELRKRFLYCAVVILVCVVVAYIFRNYVFLVLMRPLRGTPIHKLTTLGVTEAFMQVLKVSIYSGLLVASPIILYQFWAFIMPALHEHEKRSVFLYTAFTTILFLSGVVFGYFLVIPVGIKFLIGFGQVQFNQMLQADRYLSFISVFLLSFGLVFELPLIMLLLAWSRVVDYKRMRKVRKYAIVVEAIVAAVITPSQDPFSMMLMLLPLMALYELGIWLARVVAKRRARSQQLSSLTEAEGTS